MRKSLTTALVLFLLLQNTPHLLAQIAPACNPTFSVGCSGYRIYNFTYAGINNSPTAANCGISNYMSQTATVTAGTAMPYSLQMGFWMNYAIYADFDNNGNFNGTNELLFASGGAPAWNASGMLTVSGSLTIPAAVAPGSYRLRVLGLWTGPALGAGSACNTFTLAGGGNFHDYKLTVQPPCTVPAPPAAPVSRCGPGSVTLTATTAAGNTINWYNVATGGTILATGNSYTTPSVPATTTYYAAAVSASCASTRTAVPVTILPLPSVNIGNDTTICPGITYTFNAGNPGATYAWNTGASTQSINTTTAGTYSVLVTVANGCANSDAINITAGVVPVNNLPATTNLCAGATASLNAGNTGSSFLWTPGNATTQFINVTNAGTYTAQVKSVNGCVVNSITNVVIRPLPVAALGNDTSICEGDQIVLDAGNPGYSYLWSSNDTTQTIAVSDSGIYTVTVTSPYNCVHTEDKHIAFRPSPRVEGFNFIPLFYEHLGKVQFSPLNPVHVDSYEWDFGDGSALSTQAGPVHIYTIGGNYQVTLHVLNSCDDFYISLPINVNIATGMVTLSKDAADVALYPNPSRDYITIGNKSKDLKMEQVMVFNTLGAVVYDQKANSSSRHSLPVSHLASGMYTVRILTDKGWVIRKFEVIQ